MAQKLEMTQHTLEFMRSIVEDAIRSYRSNGCMSAAQVCHLYAVRYKLTTADRDYLLAEVEFWVGKKKSS